MSDALRSNSANGAMLSPTATAIETRSGLYMDLAKPRGDQFTLDDIVSGLSLTCRYGGQISRFYSVAEHSVLVYDLLEHLGADEDLLLAALFHDASEAFLGDLVSPLKFALRQAGTDAVSPYDVLTGTLDHVIADKYGIDHQLLSDDRVRNADMWALKLEAKELTATGGENWRWEGELPNDGDWPPDVHSRWSLHTCGRKPKESLLGRCSDCAWRMWATSVERHAAHIFAAATKGGFERL